MESFEPAEARPGPTPRRTRPAELEDWLNRFLYHPLSHHLALALRATPVTPNMVSVTSGLSIVAAAAAYTLMPFPQSVAAGLLFHLLWHVLDGADGDLARLTGRTSPTGELIDGAADYLGHVLLYTALAFYAQGWCWVVTPLAAASRIVQANHVESVRRTYLWRAYGIPWLGQVKREREEVFQRRNPVTRLFDYVVSGYVALGALLSPRSEETDALLEAAERIPERQGRVRQIAGTLGRRALAFQDWLGPNRRTLLLGLSMAAGTPLWFFLFECTLLNLVLAASIARQRRVNEELAAALRG